VCWVQFLQRYNPRKDYHSLLGTSVFSQLDNTTSTAAGDDGCASSNNLPQFGASGGANGMKPGSLSASLPAVSFAMEEINQEINDEPSKSNTKFQRAQTAPAATSSTRSINDRISSEIRKVWQNILRECQKYDVDRIGLITRADFTAALEHSNLDKVQ